MRLVLRNLNKNMSVEFYTHTDFKNYFGYRTKEKRVNYDSFVNETFIFKMSNPAGFFDSPPFNPYSERGSKENGINWRSTYFGAKTVSWNFTNVYSVSNDMEVSPANYLTSLLVEDLETLRLEVYTDEMVYQDFFVTDNTSLESGVIELATARGDDIFWYGAPYTKTMYFFDFYKNNGYISKIMPQVLLSEQDYPFNFTVFTSQSGIKPTFSIGGNNTGTWDKIEVTNTTTGDIFIYSNVNNDDKIIIDCANETVKNTTGTNRIANFSGDFFTLLNGNSDMVWKVNNATDYQTVSEYLPLDFRITVEYAKSISSIQYKGVKCKGR